MNYAECPQCEQPVKITGNVKLGKEITCPSCSTRLEISWLDPIELDWPTKKGEEDGYEYEDEEYEYDN